MAQAYSYEKVLVFYRLQTGVEYLWLKETQDVPMKSGST